MELSALLCPGSIAVIGASADPRKLSHRPLLYLKKHGYRGRLYAVHPTAKEILGVPAYGSIADLPEAVDLALLLVGAEGVLAAIRACQARGVRSAILFGSGFAEAGEAGRQEQARLAQLLAQGNLRLLGPNCMGLCNLRDGVAATFSQSMELDDLRAGNVAFIGQSGAVGGSVLNMAQDRGLGLSFWVTAGNQVDLDVVSIARSLLADPGTDVLCLYMEGLPSGSAYRDLLREAAQRGKQLVVLKSGRSEAGRRAALSHTGNLARTDRVFEAISRQGGAHLVSDLDELLDVALALSQMPAAAGPGLAVVTTSGGAGILLADHAEAAGLRLPLLDAATQAALGNLVPSFGATQNPVDVTAQLFTVWLQGREDAYRQCFARVGQAPGIDVLVIALTMIVGAPAVALAHDVVRSARDLGKPVLVCWLAGSLCAEAYAVLRAAGIPLYGSAAACIRAARALVQAGTERPGLAPVSEVDRRLEQVVYTEADLQPLLAAHGLQAPAAALVQDVAAAEAAAAVIGYPVVLKLQSPEILHKTDVGAVALHIADAVALRPAFAQVAAAAGRAGTEKIQGVLVQKQVAGTAELVVGVRRDPDFGCVLMAGLGGVAVEVLGDVALRALPITPDEALAMLKELRTAALLGGWRGRPAVDLGQLADLLVRTGDLALALGPDLGELEFNPVIAGPDGCYVADALLVRGHTAKEAQDATG